MGSDEKLLERILQGRADTNIGFSDLRGLLLSLGFEERTKGSHHIFRRPDVEERINLQRQGSNAKRYQVRQVRAVILRYQLGEPTDV
jgi:predicted RNA binding protein YcfA (HicA-like mRNA interferase family)